MKDFKDQLINYIKGATPLMVADTVEVERATNRIKEIIDYMNAKIIPKSSTDEWLKKTGLPVYVWNIKDGWKRWNDSLVVKGTSEDPIACLRYILDQEEDQIRAGVYVLQNFHLLWQTSDTVLALMVQYFREIYNVARKTHKYVIIVGLGGNLPAELRPYFVTLDFGLPNRQEIEDIIRTCTKNIMPNLKKKEIEEAVDAALGMTGTEISHTIYVSAAIHKKKKIDTQLLLEEKARAVKKSGLLEYIPTQEGIESIGGLSNLKEWFTITSKAFREREKAEEYCLPIPKGCLMVGIPGTGKTLSGKAISSLFGVPLFRCDAGRVFGGIVGETERNTRELFRIIDTVSPCVVLFDEVEKALAGLRSSDASDSGVTARFIGNLLYYMQEKESLSFFVFTANNVENLHGALLRKGRIDEIWFVDLPDEEEREEIIRIHLQKVKRNPEEFDVGEVVKHSKYRTGAEIESCIKSAMYKAFYEDRDINTEDIINALESTVMLASTKSEEIQALRQWGKNRARLANNIGKKIDATKGNTKKKLVAHWEDEVAIM